MVSGDSKNTGTGIAGPLRQRKRSLYEGGIRVPFIVTWPGKIPAGRVDSTSIIGAVDIVPTILDLAGVTAPAGLSAGRHQRAEPGLVPTSTERPPLFWEWLGYKKIKNSGWSCVMVAGNCYAVTTKKQPSFYDIHADPTEQKNLALQHPEVVARLTQTALTWQANLPPAQMRNTWVTE